MVETVSQSTFNFSSDFAPSYSFASTMRTCYANNKAHSINSSESSSSSSTATTSEASISSNTPNLKATGLESRRGSCNETLLRNYDHNCNNKRCSNTITTCLDNSNKKTDKPKLQLTTTTFEDNRDLLSSCTTQLSTPQSNGMISQKQQFNFENSFCGRTPKQKRSESLGIYRQCSESNDHNNNLSFDDANENSNSSEDDLVFAGELSSSPSQHHHQPKSPRQFGNNNGTFAHCKRCGGSNSSLTSFSSVSSSISSTSNLNQYTLTNCPQSTLNPQDNLIYNLNHSLNQTFNLAGSNLTPQYGRSRHNSINSLTLSNSSQTDRDLHALHKALHNIFSN